MQALPEGSDFGTREYHNQTNLHPLALVALAVLLLLTLFLPRKYAAIPALILICFIPSAQRLVIAGLDFTVLRILVYAGCMRALARGEYRGVRWQAPDLIVAAWGFVTVVAYFITWGEMGKLVQILGKITEILAIYFFIRMTVRNWANLLTIFRTLLVLAVLVAIAFAYEKATAYNVFSIFGGVPETTPMRGGRLRCMGAFLHPILAGCAWAALAPYLAALWWNKTRWAKPAAVIGVIAATSIVLNCASSTPAASWASGILAGLWFAYRHYSRVLRYGIIVALISLHLVMNKPVWHLISRIDIVGGSTGWHRYHLIDQAIRHFPEWAMFGTRGTVHWGHGLYDVTNHYIAVGVQGGFLALVLFLSALWLCFSRVGRLWRANEGSKVKRAIAWGLGVSLFVHCVSFVGVTYFGQIIFTFYFALAAIVSMAETLPRRPKPPAPSWYV